MYQSNGFVPLRRDTPVNEGLPAVTLDEFAHALERSKAKMRGYMLLRNGKVIGEKFWTPYQPENRVWVYSISKSFTATAVGLAWDAGLLGLDDKVVDFFPDRCPPKVSENLAAMRVRDLLSMTSGHAEDTKTPILSAPDGDWVRAFLLLPVQHAPGTHFVYNSGASFMLSAIVQATTGQPVLEYLSSHLFTPLGFDDVEWDQSPQDINTGGWGILVRLEDLAKLGQLYLDKGMFGGRRILSEEWVALATVAHADNSVSGNPSPDWNQGYGFQFWRCQHDAFRMDGAAGQYCVVLPKQNAVLALMSEVLDMQEIMDILWEVVLPRFDGTSSAMETGVNGRNYRLDANAPGIASASFRFDADQLELALETAAGPHVLAAGRSVWRAGETTAPLGFRSIIPLFAQGAVPKKIAAYFLWTAPDTLEIHWVYLDSPHRDRLVCRFEGDTVVLACPPSEAAQFMRAQTLELAGRAAPG